MASLHRHLSSVHPLLPTLVTLALLSGGSSFLLKSQFESHPISLGLLLGLISVAIPLMLKLFFPEKRLPSSRKEAYSLDHIILNAPYNTLWLNMGFWPAANIAAGDDPKSSEVKTTFPDACEALALKLYGAAGLDEAYERTQELRIMDVGYGTGDSILLLHQRYRPRTLHGVTSLIEQHTIAELRVQAALHRESKPKSPDGSPAEQNDVQLLCGDAVHPPSFAPFPPPSSDRPNTPSPVLPGYTHILALDCAFHFNTRQAFVREAHRRLAPGGRIALADLVLPRARSALSMKQWAAHRAVCLLAGVPWANMISLDAYVTMLKRAGFADVETEDITDRVFNGLAEFIEERVKGGMEAIREEDKRQRAGGRPIKGSLSDEEAAEAAEWQPDERDVAILGKYGAFAKVLRWWGRGNLKFVIVTASKAK